MSTPVRGSLFRSEHSTLSFSSRTDADQGIPRQSLLGVCRRRVVSRNDLISSCSRYNPRYYFAIETSYGKTADLKEMIDELHKNGIRVILDGVREQRHSNSRLSVTHSGVQSFGFVVTIDSNRSRLLVSPQSKRCHEYENPSLSRFHLDCSI